jgi:hypothetical protein
MLDLNLRSFINEVIDDFMTAAIDRLADEAWKADRLDWPVMRRVVQSERGLLFRVVGRPLGPSAR